MKHTKKALLMSCLSLLLCMSMLVGTTFAWFTDTASTGVNTIVAGNLDIVLEYMVFDEDGKGTWEEVTTDSLLFEEGALYEPGYTEVAYIRVRNAGNLVLKYDLTVAVANEKGGINKAGEAFKLSDHIKFGVISSDINGKVTIYNSREDAQEAVKDSATNLQTYSSATDNRAENGYITLNPEETIEMALVVFMPTTVGNEANYKTGTTPPSIQLGVNVFATQKDSEEDSYGPDYDELAPNMINIGETVYDTVAEAIAAAEDGDVINLSRGTYVLPMSTVDVSMINKTLTIKGTKDTVIDYTGMQVNYVNNMAGANLTFEGVTVNWLSTESYQGLKNVEKATYKNCTINGLQFLYGDAEFIECTFNNQDCWSVWTYVSENVTFTGCTFNTGGHAVLNYNDFVVDGFEANISFEDCTFHNSGTVNEQWGHEDLVETGANPYNSENKYNLSFTDCTITGSDKQSLWGNKNNLDAEHLSVTVDGKTVIMTATQDELNNAILNATADEPIAVALPSGEFEFPRVSMTNKDVTFSSTEDTVVDLTYVQINYFNNIAGATLTFEGVTVKWSDDNDDYQGLKDAEKVVYKDCTIIGTQFMYSDADFIDCTFVTVDSYAVYTRESGNYTFTNCTFTTGGRAIMMYNDGPIEVNITLTDCVFYDDGTYASKDKAAVETGDEGTKSSVFNIIIENCTVSGFEANNSTSPLWGNKDSIPANRLSVTINGEKVY